MIDLFSTDTLMGVVWIMAMLITHELGHYWVAKHHGIYKGWSIIPGGLAVNMTTYLPNRWQYLAGIPASFLAFPIFLMFKRAADPLWIYPVCAVSIAVVDIFVFIFYTPIIKEIEKEYKETRELLASLKEGIVI